MRIVIARQYDNLQTMGSLFVLNGQEVKFRCKTLELPDLGNQRSVSCIPEGTYICEKWDSPTKGECFRVLNVPGRDSILIHKGNYAAGRKSDTEGCILPGGFFQDINNDGNLDVGGSTKAMQSLLEIMPNKFKLHIV